MLQAQLRYGEMGRSERRVADFLLSRSDGFSPVTITELAKLCNSSEATIVRFSRRLGFSGYRDLQLSLAKEEPGVTVTPHIEERDSCYEIFEKVCNDAYLSLERTKKTVSADALDEAATVLADASRIVLIGLGSSASVAQDMANKLIRAGCNATSYSDTHMQAIAVSFLGPGDVLVGVSQSGTSKDIVETMKAGRLKGAQTVCITGGAKSPLTRHSDIVLLTDTDETRHSQLSLSSHIARQMLVDALCYHVVSRSAVLRANYLDENGVDLASKRVTE